MASAFDAAGNRVIDRSRRQAFIGEDMGLSQSQIVNRIDVSKAERIGALAEKKGSTRTLAIAPSSNRLLTSSDAGAVLIWDVESGRLIKRFGRFKRDAHSIMSVSVSPDEKTVAIGCGYGIIELWSLDNFSPIREPLEHGDDIEGPPWCVEFSPQGSFLAAAGDDGVIRLWNTVDYEQVAEFKAHDGWIRDTTFSPDGQFLASAADDGAVRLWDTKTTSEVRTLAGHTGVVTCLGFSPNGRLLASGSYDTSILLWNVDAAVAGKK